LAPAAQRELMLDAVEMLSTEVADVAVIGGGVTGLSAASTASAAGARVVVLEAANRLGAGATGRNAGILSAGINMGLTDMPPDAPEAELWTATTQALLALVAEADAPGSLLVASLTGALSLAERPSAARRLRREARARQAAGLRAEIWLPAQVAEATGERLDARSVVNALWLPDEGRIDPLSLLAQRARQARQHGALLMGRARVEGYEAVRTRGGAHHWRIRLTGGRTLMARGLILAVGPTVAPTARIYALAFPIDLPDTFPLFWDAAPYIYSDHRPGSGRLVVSGGRYGRAGSTGRDAHYHAQLAGATRRWLPELVDQAPSHAWAVDLDVSADLMPRMRDLVAAAPGVAIEGLGALGVLPGTVLGRRAGESIARRLGICLTAD
jgi:glycine/D-amino acid oxidase-like deaminating enzyme